MLDKTGGQNAIEPQAEAKSKTQGIAILGSHPATVAQAPFDREDWLIYACSPHNFEKRKLPRWDQWFEIHLPAGHETRSFHYLRMLEQSARDKVEAGDDVVVWMRDAEAMPFIPASRAYPERDLKAFNKFGPWHFTSSIAFMLAKAIDDCEKQGIPEIGIWGVMQASATEYAYQRPGIQFMILEAVRRGIKVYAPRESCLFEPPKEDF